MAAPPAPDGDTLAEDVKGALAEDIGSGDLTAGLIPREAVLATRVICRDHAILAGRPWFDETFRQFPEPVAIDWQASDGDSLSPGQEVCRLQGHARTLLTAERTALNFIQTLSGTATVTRRYVEAIQGAGAGTGRGTRILDTRKTLPGLRLAQKYAVACGGGSNHRSGLYDAILIKENHINAAGSIGNAVAAARDGHAEVPLEVEVESQEELAEAVASGAQRVLLDNFDLAAVKAAVAAFGGQIELEASGDVTLANIREIAATGVDFISVGAITKHLEAVDFSMRFV